MHYFYGFINIIPIQHDNRLHADISSLPSCMKVHILGISGTFMSGIAILAKKKGYEVTGSDTSCYDPIKSILEKENISVIKGHKIKDIKDKDLIIIGNVMSRGNPIIEYILKNNIN